MCVMTPYTLVRGYQLLHRNILSPISLISSEDVGSGILGKAGTQIQDYAAPLYKYHNPDTRRDKYFKSGDLQYVFI